MWEFEYMVRYHKTMIIAVKHFKYSIYYSVLETSLNKILCVIKYLKFGEGKSVFIML